MTYLHYQLWGQKFRTKWEGRDGDEPSRTLLASGTIQVTSTISAPITVPSLSKDEYSQRITAVLKAKGTAPVYVELRPDGTTPNSASAHAASDTAPRILLEEGDGAVMADLGGGAKFAAVQAAALT